MRERIVVLALIGLLAASGCTSSPLSPLGEMAGVRGEGAPPTALGTGNQTPSAANIAQLMAGMSLEQKVGQVFMLGITGTEANQETLALVRELHLGGVVLFARNTESPAQVRALTEGLQHEAHAQPGGIPLFVAIDQEGGVIGRISQGVTLLPGNMALGATGDVGLARSAGAVLGRELLAMGINMNLAPVLDVNSNPANPVIGVRSFGGSPEQVARLGRALIAGQQEGGVFSVAKHFPGHGDTSDDSHFALPVVNHDRQRLDQVDLLPFRAAIADGVDGIMTAHIALPALESRPGTPATLSQAVVTGLLREQLGYRGLVLTDALDMAPIKDTLGVSRGAVEAFRAGADLLLIAGIKPDDLAVRRQAFEALLEAVRAGDISEARLDASVRRILEAKDRRGLLDPGCVQPELDVVGSEQHRRVPDGIAAQAVTLIRDDANLLPLNASQRVLVVRPETPLSSPAEELTATGALGQAVRSVAPQARELVVSAQPTASQVEQAVSEARAADRVVVASYDAWRWPRQQALIRALAGSGTPIVVLAVRAPYDLLAMPEIPTYLAVYSDRPAALQVAAQALFGRVPTPGRLPVDLPGLYPLGHGLDLQPQP